MDEALTSDFKYIGRHASLTFDIMEKVWLKSGKEASLYRRHPWIFSGAIGKKSGNLQDGTLVLVMDMNDKALGAGHYFNGSIAVKLLSFPEEHFDGEEQTIQKQLISAHALRQKQTWRKQTTAYRLCHGEGDGLPGLIIDVYGDTAVVQCHSPGMHRKREYIATCLSQLGFNHVYDKSAETLPHEFAAELPNQWLAGGTEHIHAEEYGIKYHIDPISGQKTGFFLDQRENRHLLSAFCSGASVLNTFCYTGGFSLMALKAGAEKVVSVDVSAKALQTLEQNLVLNGLQSEKHLSIKQDAKEYLKHCEEQFDVIILDPPAYAKHLGARHKAVQAYRRLNESGMRLLKPGGYLLTFSCSQVVEASLFYGAVTAAAIDCGRKTRILNYLSQGPDHPVSIFHPEGRYLKGLLLHLD